MVKNHLHGAIGSMKHGSGEHLRDKSAKRMRIEEGTSTELASESDPAAQRFAAICARESADMTGEELTIEDSRIFANYLAAPDCRLVVLDLKHIGYGHLAAEILAGAFKANKSLTRLNIERNGLAISGTQGRRPRERQRDQPRSSRATGYWPHMPK